MTERKRYLKNIIASVMTAFMLILLAMPCDVFALVYSAEIGLSQVFTGVNAPEGDEFTYILTAKGGAPLPEGATGTYEFKVKGTAEKTITISGIPYGEYEYSLKCRNDSRAGYDIDGREYSIFVYARTSDNMTGSEAAIVIIKDEKEDKTVKASFSHSYGSDPDPFIAVDPPVRKSVKGAPPEDAVFKFRLRAADNDAGYGVSDMPMPEGSSGREKYVTVTGEGEEEFGEWTYTRPGTYIYDISEVDTGLKDYKYDKRMFTITDTVTLKDGVFSVSRTIVDSNGKVVQNTLIRSNDDERTVRLGFVNEYTGNGSDDGNKDKDKDKDKEDGGRRIWRNVKTGDVVRLAPYFSAVLAAIILLIVFIRRRRSTSN